MSAGNRAAEHGGVGDQVHVLAAQPGHLAAAQPGPAMAVTMKRSRADRHALSSFSTSTSLMDVNLGTALWLSQAVEPYMRQRGKGSIVHAAARPATDPTAGIAARAFLPARAAGGRRNPTNKMKPFHHVGSEAGVEDVREYAMRIGFPGTGTVVRQAGSRFVR